MATLPPFTDQSSSAEPPSLSHLPVLTEEIELELSHEDLVHQNQSPEPQADATPTSLLSTTSALNATIDPAYMQQFLAQTIDDALVQAIQQSMPRFIAQVRTQVAATVQRRLREEIKRLQTDTGSTG